MNVKQGLCGRSVGEERGKEKILWGKEDQNMLHVYVLRQHNEANDVAFKNGGRKGNITEEANLFKIYHRHVQNYQSKTFSYY
jgi:hypothetical protein